VPIGLPKNEKENQFYKKTNSLTKEKAAEFQV
jgi:hypothetical protein